MEEEKKIKNMPDPVTISGTETILNQMKNCICKIKINKTNGTGFFCTINCENKKTMNVLMTNYHVLDENYYALNNELNLFINDDKDVKILNLKIKRKTYFNKKYDLAMIELKESDNIKHFLELDDNLFKNEIKAFYKDISIYTLQYPLGNNATVSYGLSNGINNFEINHTCSTEHGSSGSPILNLSHKQSAKRFNYNIGTCLQFPLNDFFGKDEININIIKKENEENNKIDNDILNKYEKIRNEFNRIINIMSDIIPDLKYQIGPGPKMNVIFRTHEGCTNNLLLNYGTTLDQMLKIYLKIRGLEDYYINKSNQICFLWNANKIKFGDKTPIEIYFKNAICPKIVFNDIGISFSSYEDEKIRLFCLSLIQEIMDFLDPKPKNNDYNKNCSNKDIKDITIKFNNGGNIIKIKMSNDSMVAELINEYYEKTKTEKGTFYFNDTILIQMDTSCLYEVGLCDNSEIIVK